MTDCTAALPGRDQYFNFPNLSATDFNSKCGIDYRNSQRKDKVDCWLNGSLPDLKQQNLAMQNVTKGHLAKLIGLGIDGFRFDAAKHMEPSSVKMYIAHLDSVSGGQSWNHLEVIEDEDSAQRTTTSSSPPRTSACTRP